MPGIPTLVLPNGRNVSVLDAHLIASFATFPPATQKEAVKLVKGVWEAVNADGSIPHLISLQVITPERAREFQEGDAFKLRHITIDNCSWQLAQFLRYSKPTRISEAVAPLTFLVNAHKAINQGAIDSIPTLYLGVALSRIPGEEEHAIKTFKEAVENTEALVKQRPAKNLLWARANLARLYRLMNRVPEAMEQERMARDWIIGQIYTYAPSVFKGVIEDEIGTGEHITDHGDVLELFSQIQELRPPTAIFKGMLVQYGGQ